jgi:ABC-2 type transport system permease protein
MSAGTGSKTAPTAGTPGPTHRAARRPAFTLEGLGFLLRVNLRISRRQIIIWALAFLVMIPSSVLAMEAAYPDQEALDARAMLLDNPSAVMMTGPAFATDDYTFWAMVANELFLYVLIPAAIMAILLTVRHTRGDEEAGRLEMLRALPVGRFAPTAAAMLLVAIASLALGVVTAAGLLLAGGPAADSLAMAAATGLTGLLFGAVAAVAAQVTEHAGSASGMSLGVLALAVVVRGFGDVIDRQGSWLSWFSPIAWAQQMRLYVDLRWWPLLVTVAVTILLLLIATQLSQRRDLGAGLRAARPGPGHASMLLTAPGGLARRLLTPMLLAWTIGLSLFAIGFGTLASSLEDLVVEVPAMGEWVPLDMEDLTTSFAAVLLTMLALGPVGLLVAGILRLRTEEVEGRLAGVLLAGRSRTRVTGTWVLVVVIAVVVIQVLLGLGVGVGLWAATEDAAWIGDLTLASLAYLPGILLCGAVAFALYGLHVRASTLAWAVVIWTAIVTFLGGLLGLPDWASALSPLWHVPLVPDADWKAAPLLIMTGTSAVLIGIGLLALRRRDLAGG